MPCGANGCRRAVTCSLSNPQARPWITDDLLERTFNDFARTFDRPQRRHGSNVPGPFECRRRQAKRRMGGLAAVDISHERGWLALPGLGSLFGPAPTSTDWTWQAPSAKVQQDRSRNLEETVTRSIPRGLDGTTTASNTHMVLPIRRKSPQHVLVNTNKVTKCQDLDDIRQLYWCMCPSGAESITFSKMAFKHLLDLTERQLNSEARLTFGDMEQISDFLSSDLDEPVARNTRSLLDWIMPWDMAETTFQHLLQIVSDKLALSTLHHADVLAILGLLPRLRCSSMAKSSRLCLIHKTLQSSIASFLASFDNRAKALSIVNTQVALLCSVPPCLDSVSLALESLLGIDERERQSCASNLGDYIASWIHSKHASEDLEVQKTAVQAILRGSALAYGSTLAQDLLRSSTRSIISRLSRDSEDGSILDHWMTVLRAAEVPPAIWSHLYCHLAQRLRPNDIYKHLIAVEDAADVARIILRHWQIPRILSDLQFQSNPLPASDIDNQATSSSGLLELYTQDPDSPSAQSDTITEQIVVKIEQHFENRMKVGTGHRSEFDGPPIFFSLLQVICSLRHFGVLSKALTNDYFDLLMAIGNPGRVYKAFLLLRVRACTISSETARNLIHFFLEHNRAAQALDVFKQTPEMFLSDFPQLALALLDGAIKNRKQDPLKLIMQLLNRPDPDNSVPVSGRTYPTNTLTPERVHLVHVVAYEIARAPHLDPRRATRRVWDLYHYLRDRQAPLSGLMSRALVHAGVTRYLREGRWLSTMRFRWILYWVKEIEGEHVAARLDKLAFVWRRRIFLRRDASSYLGLLQAQAKQDAERVRWQFGHGSHRWKRRTVLWRKEMKGDDKKPLEANVAIRRVYS